ncbi:MAG: hypothetical protein J7L61_02470 [Thermoplasmata archaeon]|nr:hypothetical protein [Thermoplasmata archaeon]
MEEIEFVSKRIVDRMELGEVTGIPYETAWFARAAYMEGWPMFHRCTDWLLRGQREDGSWGGSIPMVHDRVISTLSVLTALGGPRGGDGRGRVLQATAVKKAESFLWDAIPRLSLEKVDTIGFEVLFPALMDEAEEKGFSLPFHLVSPYRRLRERRLESIPPEDIYTGLSSLTNSLEGLAGDLDRERAASMPLVNGSVLSSPSATVFLAMATGREDAWKYVFRVRRASIDGGIPPQYPIDAFEKIWVIYNFLQANVPVEYTFPPHLDHLLSGMKERGISWTSWTRLADGDDTALALYVLREFHCPANPRALESYENEDYFICFPGEMNPSVSTNIHILHAVQRFYDYPRRDEVVDKIVRFLGKSIHGEGFWADKWHISPYYPTGHAVLALAPLGDSLVERPVGWLLSTQNPDGGWGFTKSTLEETSYALQALFSYEMETGEILDDGVLSAGMDFLMRNIGGEREELWVGKGLYTPTVVVDSLIVSVLYTGARRLGISSHEWMFSHTLNDVFLSGGTNPGGVVSPETSLATPGVADLAGFSGGLFRSGRPERGDGSEMQSGTPPTSPVGDNGIGRGER